MYDENLVATIKDYMADHGESLAVAESVTSGHLQAALSLAKGASEFFQGGITVYNLGQKARHLHINPIHATSCNCVSAIVAEEMALNALSLFSSDWSLAITGYASPVPELGIYDLFAFYAIGYKTKILRAGKIVSNDKGALQVQLHFTNMVLKELVGELEANRSRPAEISPRFIAS